MCVLLSARHLDGGIPGAPWPLDDALDIARHPAGIIFSGLGMSALAVDIALPGANIEGEVALDALVALGGLLVGPYPVHDRVISVDRAHHGVVGRSALPLAKGRPRRGGERNSNHICRYVVSYGDGEARARVSAVANNDMENNLPG